LTAPTGDQCEAAELLSVDANGVRSYAMWHPQWGGYVGKCVVTYCITKDERGRLNNTCFDVKVWHDGDFPTDDDGGETQEFHYCDPGQMIRFGRRVIKAMNDGGVDIVDPVGALEDRVAELEAENALLRLPVGIESAAMALALRRIAAVVGAPAGLGSLADLDGLVQFVRSRVTSGGTP